MQIAFTLSFGIHAFGVKQGYIPFRKKVDSPKATVFLATYCEKSSLWVIGRERVPLGPTPCGR